MKREKWKMQFSICINVTAAFQNILIDYKTIKHSIERTNKHMIIFVCIQQVLETFTQNNESMLAKSQWREMMLLTRILNEIC